MKANRRQLLKLFAAAPLGAQAAVSALTASGVGLLSRSVDMAVPQAAMTSGNVGPKLQRFNSWASFFSKTKMDKEVRRQAMQFQGFDPDILAMQSLSLDAKMRMQRERNYHKIIDERRWWFEQDLDRYGFAERYL